MFLAVAVAVAVAVANPTPGSAYFSEGISSIMIREVWGEDDELSLSLSLSLSVPLRMLRLGLLGALAVRVLLVWGLLRGVAVLRELLERGRALPGA